MKGMTEEGDAYASQFKDDNFFDKVVRSRS